MVALWTFQVVTQLTRFALVVSPDLVAATGASTLVHVCDVVFPRRGLPLGMRTALWRRFAGMRGLSEFCHVFGLRFFLRGLSARRRHESNR